MDLNVEPYITKVRTRSNIARTYFYHIFCIKERIFA